MIEVIGEVTGSNVVRADQQTVIAGQDSTIREMERAVARRPVEQSSDAQKQKAEAEKKEELKSGYNLEHKFPVFEKYNQDGELVLQIPPVHEERA